MKREFAGVLEDISGGKAAQETVRSNNGLDLFIMVWNSESFKQFNDKCVKVTIEVTDEEDDLGEDDHGSSYEIPTKKIIDLMED